MISYRTLAQGIQKRAGISFDQSLASIAIILKAVAHQLEAGEFAAFRRNIAPELRQLVVEGRLTGAAASGGRDGRLVVELVRSHLDIGELDAKTRVVALLDELRAAVSPWDDVFFAEIIDRMRSAVDAVLVQAAVA